ncbi:MAG: ABC transporter substrate-binding protein [Candidatus Rokuibacteriota bacterium]
MARPTTLTTRREFLTTSSALAVGATAALSFPAPALAQRPKLVYWCYQFLKASDEARADFARDWAKKHNVDLQLTMVPWKEFMAKITAAIEAKATPDIVESGGVELRGRGQLLDVTDIYKKVEKTWGPWVGPSAKIMQEPDGKVHTVLYGLQGFMLITRDDLLAQAGLKPPPATWVDLLAYAKKAQQPPRTFGIGQAISNQTDSQVWEDIMKSYGARLADETGKRVVLGDYKGQVWEFLDYFDAVWKSGVLPPGVVTWDNTMNNSTYQAGKAVFVFNPVTISLWLEANNPELLAKTGHYTYPAGPKGRVQPLTYGSRSILKYTKVPDVAKQFLYDSMEPTKMDREMSVAQWGPVLKSYLGFDVWKKKPFMKSLIDMSLKGEPQGYPDVFNDAWREQHTNTVISRMLQRIVVDNWSRDKALSEAVDLLNKIYTKYA